MHLLDHRPLALTCLLFLSQNVVQYLHSLGITPVLCCAVLSWRECPSGSWQSPTLHAEGTSMVRVIAINALQLPCGHQKPTRNRRPIFFTARKAGEESKAMHPQILKRHNSWGKKKKLRHVLAQAYATQAHNLHRGLEDLTIFTS